MLKLSRVFWVEIHFMSMFRHISKVCLLSVVFSLYFSFIIAGFLFSTLPERRGFLRLDGSFILVGLCAIETVSIIGRYVEDTTLIDSDFERLAEAELLKIWPSRTMTRFTLTLPLYRSCKIVCCSKHNILTISRNFFLLLFLG